MSVRLSVIHRSTAAVACGGFAAVGPISCCMAGAQQQLRAVPRCQLTYEAECRRVAVGVNGSFGMQHDTAENGCESTPGELQHVMSPQMTAEASPLVWSDCSRNAITVFLESVPLYLHALYSAMYTDLHHLHTLNVFLLAYSI